MKKTAIILTGVLALMAVAPMAASAQTTSIEPTTEQTTSKTQQQQVEINSPSDYIKWLKGQDGAEETLEQFSKLSESDQDKFIKYLNDVDVQKQVVKAFGSEKDVSLFGGDIVVSHKEDAPSKDTSSKVTPQAMNYTVSDSSKGTFLGITVSELRSTVTYRVSGTPGNQQIEVLSGGGMVVRNYNPIIGITVNQERPYTSADRQYAYQVNYFAHDFKGTWGLTYGTVKHTLSGDTQGREVRLISETL